MLNVGWNGAKGTRLDVLTAPGRNATSSLSGVYYNYSDSIGFSNYNAGTVRLRKRLQGGIALGATYTYSHAIDDASAIGGNGGTTAGGRAELAEHPGGGVEFIFRHPTQL